MSAYTHTSLNKKNIVKYKTMAVWSLHEMNPLSNTNSACVTLICCTGKYLDLHELPV